MSASTPISSHLRRTVVTTACALSALIAGCSKDSTPPLVATTLTPSVSSITLDAIGATQPITATVKDQNGAVMTSVAVTFASNASTIASVSGGGSATVTAVGNGSTTITALAGSLTATIPVTVAQAPVAPVKLAGDAQTATVGAAVTTQLRVRVQDRLGNAMAGRAVTFAVTAGGGTVTPTAAQSGADGSATASWVLGTVPGAQAVTATTAGVTDAATFTATANVGAPASVAATAGNNQTAIAGAAVATPLAVKVADAFGNGVPGVSVAFAIATGGGTIAGSPATTNASGIATAGTWTLGTAAGAKTVTATVTGLTAVTFTATATAGPAAIMSLNAGNAQTVTQGLAVPTLPSVKITDANANPVSGVAVTFAVASGGGSITGANATTNAAGIATVGSWTLGSTAGANTLSASAAGLTTVTFTATAAAPVPAAIAVSAGNGQSATVSTSVAIAPAVRVTDAQGNGVGGVSVTFAVATGGGSATGTTTTTNSAGVATVGSWTLGAVAGTNSLTATAAGSGISGNPVTFTATGTAAGGGGGGGTNFKIELRYLTVGTSTQIAAFDSAAARWQRIITAKMPDVLLNQPAGQCGSNAPAINETIDDLVIYVTFEAIDGVGGTLGSAGPCFVRNSNGIPVVGRMRFDVADLASLESSGLLQSTILHEMGHVLGIGSLWDFSPYFAFLQNPSLPSSPGVDTRYSGTNGIAGFNTIGGSTYTGGLKVPVENTQGGSGTRDAHWRESVLQNELMTGFIGSGSNPLSVLTIRSLQDFGYTVNTAQADAFFLTLTSASLQVETGRRIQLINDVNDDPIKVVGPMGSVLRTLQRKRP